MEHINRTEYSYCSLGEFCSNREDLLRSQITHLGLIFTYNHEELQSFHGCFSSCGHHDGFHSPAANISNDDAPNDASPNDATNGNGTPPHDESHGNGINEQAPTLRSILEVHGWQLLQVINVCDHDEDLQQRVYAHDGFRHAQYDAL